MCFLICVLNLFIESWKTCQLMWENFFFLVIFDTCDVMYNWFNSLLPSIVLNNLFAITYSEYFLYRWSTRLQNVYSYGGANCVGYILLLFLTPWYPMIRRVSGSHCRMHLMHHPCIKTNNRFKGSDWSGGIVELRVQYL